MEAEAEERLGWKELSQRIALLFVTVTLVIFTLSSLLGDVVDPLKFEAGTVAQSSIVATRDFLIEDRQGTDEKRAEAESIVRRVFALNDSPQIWPSSRVRQLFQFIDTEMQSQKSSASTGSSDAPTQTLRKRLDSVFRLNFTESEIQLLLDPEHRAALLELIEEHANPLMERGVVANKRLLATDRSRRSIALKRASTGEEQVISQPNRFHSLAEARDSIESSLVMPSLANGANSSAGGIEDELRLLAARLGQRFLRPNIVFDQKETERRFVAARQTVEPVYYRIERGDIIVRAGDLITPTQFQKLERLRELRSGPGVLQLYLGYLVLASLTIALVYIFFSEFWSKFAPSTRDLALHATLLVGSFVLLKFWMIVGEALTLRFPTIGEHAFLLATPFAIGGILLQVTVGASAVSFFLIVFALLSGIFLEDSWLLLLLIVLGNIVAALSVREAPRRSIFLVAGLRLAILNSIVTLCYISIVEPLSPETGAAQLIAAFCGGLLSGILAAASTPVVEYLGGYISDIKLLELASLDRPLLRDLSIQAPGTWNHSMVMGQLGESAAKAIGANALLTRVGAYYHDIGKMTKPAYFIENQAGKENRHDKLSPSMSALIIKTHVKDGLELAAEYKLPSPIKAFISEHHGTNLIEYFYEKAKKEAADGEEVDDSLYRYAGPKPQTKETGIMMLADAVEACSRVLTDPTPARIQGMVQKIVNKLFASGQLDETDLTLRDLHLIANRFIRVLSGIFHKRIQYSSPVEKTAQIEKAAERAAEKQSEKFVDTLSGTENGSSNLGETAARERLESDGEKAVEDQDRVTAEGDTREALKRLGIAPVRGESTPH